MIFLDTHIVLWLANGTPGRLTKRAVSAIESDRPLISPIVTLELAILWEIGRVLLAPTEVVDRVRQDVGAQIAADSIAEVAAAAATLAWTRDPFDRLICGHALAAGGALVTADRLIRANFPAARW